MYLASYLEVFLDIDNIVTRVKLTMNQSTQNEKMIVLCICEKSHNRLSSRSCCKLRNRFAAA